MPASIRLANVTFAYPQSNPLIHDSSFHLSVGWTGVVGENGAGKSTLLALLNRAITPDSGEILRNTHLPLICSQRVDSDESVHTFANAWTPDAMRWQSLLDLSPGDHSRWDELSTGTKRRWQIGAALFRDPDALLLDEPTNHLDARGREVLIQALRRYDGLGVVVSHDRSFLDELTDRTLRIHRANVTMYPGPYSESKALWEAEESALRDELEQLQSLRDRSRRELSAARTRHAGAKHALTSRTRMSSVRDSDARSTARKCRAESAERAIGRGVGVAKAALMRADIALDAFEFRPGGNTASLQILGTHAPMTHVVNEDLEALCVGERVLLPPLTFSLERDARRWMRGPNGCGKSTLARRLVAGLSPRVRERTLFVPQTMEALMRDVDVVFRRADRDRAETIFQLAAALGLDVSKLVSLRGNAPLELSPGEWRKAAFACALSSRAWLIIMDEPTNDLDISSLERLEGALNAYAGALLVITHDPIFANNIRAQPLELPWLLKK